MPFGKSNDDMGMHRDAPSFLSHYEEYTVKTPDDVLKISDEKRIAALFIPSSGSLSGGLKWVNALSSIDYLVINCDEKEGKKLADKLERIVFSAVPRRISAVFITPDLSKALPLLDSAGKSGFRTVLIKEEDL